MQFNDFHSAFLAILKQVYLSPQFINAPRGNYSKECLNTSFCIKNPIQRVCYLSSRKTNIIFNFAEVLWYLSGSNNLSYIEYYCQNMKRYSLDSKTLPGTGYGKKIFHFGASNINQWARTFQLLDTDDPDTKRAFIQIFDANENLFKSNIDVSCTLGLQFFIRKNALYLVSFMRANDCFRGIVSDIFSFTFMQELMANQLGVGLGFYYHNAGSIHAYEVDDFYIKRVLNETESLDKAYIPNFEFPKMPMGNNWPFIKEILKYEEDLRLDNIQLTLTDIEDTQLPKYWKQILILFSFYNKLKHQKTADLELIEEMIPVYRYFILNRWGEKYPELSRTTERATK